MWTWRRQAWCQQTQHFEPGLIWCCSTVFDAGPTLAHSSCYLGFQFEITDKCLSWLFLLPLNAYVMGLPPLSDYDVYRRQIVTSNVGPRVKQCKEYDTAVDMHVGLHDINFEIDCQPDSKLLNVTFGQVCASCRLNWSKIPHTEKQNVHPMLV